MAKKVVKVIGIVAGVIVIVVVSLVIIVNVLTKNLNDLKEAKFANIDITQVKDGQYLGQYQALPITVKLNVTVDSGKLLKIDLIEHTNGQGKPAEAIINEIIKQQKLDVDVISGATFSSVVIKKAIEKALKSGE